MPDPELQWTPDETVPPHSGGIRAISLAVLAVSFVVIGIVIGRLTAGIPARTLSEPPPVVGAPSAKKPAEPVVEKPSLALKSDTETRTQKPASPPSTEGELKTNPPPVVLLNPGTAGKSPSAAREDVPPRPQPARDRTLRSAPQENREPPPATGERRDTLSRPARDYQSLREYMLGR
jgi:hypothetical protein